MTALFRFPAALRRDPAVDEWLGSRPPALAPIAQAWFEQMRRCGNDVRELMHDGCPVACVEEVAFAYVNTFTAHVNVGFYLGSLLDDPAGLLHGDGKRMRHVKLRPGDDGHPMALSRLIEDAYADARMKYDLQRVKRNTHIPEQRRS